MYVSRYVILIGPYSLEYVSSGLQLKFYVLIGSSQPKPTNICAYIRLYLDISVSVISGWHHYTVNIVWSKNRIHVLELMQKTRYLSCFWRCFNLSFLFITQYELTFQDNKEYLHSVLKLLTLGRHVPISPEHVTQHLSIGYLYSLFSVFFGNK